MENTGEFGICCNIAEPDSCLRLGSKAWVAMSDGGNGFERVPIVGRTRGGRLVHKWVPLRRLYNFRPAFVQPHLDREITFARANDKEALREACQEWGRRAAEWRDRNPYENTVAEAP